MPIRLSNCLLGGSLLLASASPALAGDTTYSETRSVPRERPGAPPSGESSPEPLFDGDNEAGSLSIGDEEERKRQTFLQDCLTPDRIRSASELGFVLVSYPFRLGLCYVVDNFRESHAFLFAGGKDLSAGADRPWRFGWGFGFGALYMPGAAGGMPFTLHAEALGFRSPSTQFRLRLGSFGSLLNAPYDYERTVLVDGRPIGIQRDSLQYYSYSGYHLLAERLWTGSRGLYLSLGGGAVLMRETFGFTQTTDYGPAPEPREDLRSAVRPLLSLAVGRMDLRGGGRSLHRFEIRYQAALLLPDRRSSFPADNSASTHSLTWDWGWLW